MKKQIFKFTELDLRKYKTNKETKTKERIDIFKSLEQSSIFNNKIIKLFSFYLFLSGTYLVSGPGKCWVISWRVLVGVKTQEDNKHKTKKGTLVKEASEPGRG